MIHIDFSNYPFKQDLIITIPNNSQYGYVNSNRPYNIAEINDMYHHNVKWKYQPFYNENNFFMFRQQTPFHQS